MKKTQKKFFRKIGLPALTGLFREPDSFLKLNSLQAHIKNQIFGMSQSSIKFNPLFHVYAPVQPQPYNLFVHGVIFFYFDGT